MSVFVEGKPLLTGNYSQPFGIGFELELIQRAAKAQIITYLPELTLQLQDIWAHRDKEYEEFLGESKIPIFIPKVEKQNIISGVESFSILESSPEMWPSIFIYTQDGIPSMWQADHWDDSSVTTNIEVMCLEGPVKTENIHNKEGFEVMQTLDSKLQRLSDAVYMCIQKDKTLSGTVGQFEKPPKTKTSLPAQLKENIKNTTGESYIYQGKQFSFVSQKISY